MRDAAGTGAGARGPWHSRVPARTMAIWLALIAVVFVTRNRWEATWVEESRLPEPSKFLELSTISDDGRWVVVNARDHLFLWDVKTGRSLAEFEWNSCCEAVSPQGDRIVIQFPGWSARASSPVIIDVKTGATIAVLKGHKGFVQHACFSPDGSRIVTASRDKEARVWDARTGISLLTLHGHTSSVHAADYSPEGLRIVTGGNDGTARIWDAESGKPLSILEGHDGVVLLTRFLLGGRRVATLSLNSKRRCRLWHAQTGRLLATIDFMSLDFSPDGEKIVAATRTSRIVTVWDAGTGLQIAQLIGKEKDIRSARVSRGGDCVITAAAYHGVSIWDTETGKRVATISSEEFGESPEAYLTPDNRRIITWPVSNSARICDVRTGKLLATVSNVQSCCVLDDTRMLVSDGVASAYILRRLRPEWWWGVFYLWHFWAIVVLALALGLSVWRDVRDLRRARAA